jgi:hypothetical protein
MLEFCNFCGFLLYLVNLFHSIEFFWNMQICTALHRIIEFSDSKNDIHVAECSACEAVSRNIPQISNMFMKQDHELAGELFLKSIKRKRSPKIMKLVEIK